MSTTSSTKTHRRGFLGLLATSAASLGLTTLMAPVKLGAVTPLASEPVGEADAWINKIHGSHKTVFDATHPHELFPFAWPRVFLMTNGKTGVPEKDCCAVVVLRHSAICYAFENRLWADYKFGEIFEAKDPKTKLPSTRNPFWEPQPDDFKIPGIGPVPIGINQLQQSGVMFCVCETAMTVYSAITADSLKKEHAEVLNDWKKGLLPGIQIVPSGVWALGRAQEKGCGYVFTG